MKKTSIYLDTNLEYLVTSYNLLMMSQVVHLKKRSAKGRLAFTIKDDPVFTDVLIQISSNGKLNIYPPEDAPKEEIIEKLLKLLSDANQASVKVLRRLEARPPIEHPKKATKRIHATLGHSRQLSLGLEAILAEYWLFYRHTEPSKQREQWREKIELKGNRLKEFAIEHLRSGYSDTYDKLMRWRKLKEKAKEALLKGHGRGKWRGVEQHTFLTPEAKRCLLNYREWMRNTRQVEFERNGHVYVSLHNASKGLTIDSLGITAHRICERLPFKFSWHDGRRYVQTALEEAGLTRNWVQKIKGRRVRSEDDPYSRPEIEKLRDAYQKALHCLCFLDTEALTNRVEMDRVKLALGERTLREQELTREVEELKFKFASAKDALEIVMKYPQVLEELLKKAKKEKGN